MRIHTLVNLIDITHEPNLMSRDLAVAIFDRLRSNSEGSKVEINFKGIEFISRAFADQFHKDKLNLHKVANIELIVKDCNDSVFNMFKEVSKTNDPSFRRKYSQDNFSVSIISSRKELRNLNLSF